MEDAFCLVVVQREAKVGYDVSIPMVDPAGENHLSSKHLTVVGVPLVRTYTSTVLNPIVTKCCRINNKEGLGMLFNTF